MIKLTKKFEYGLLAIQHIAGQRAGEVATAKEIAECYGMPYDLVAKTLQQMVRGGLVDSTQGARGGYRLSKPAGDITISEVMAAIEGPINLIECETDGSTCDAAMICSIKRPLSKIQKKLRDVFDEATLEEILT
jgi:Rrf2 family protein